jgi:subtilase family serine protease
MPRPEIRRSAVRRRPTPFVELLEGRALLNATSMTNRPAIEVHAEVAKATTAEVKLAKQEKAAAAKEAKQEKAAAAKLFKQEKAAEAKQTKQEKAAEAKAIKASPLGQDKQVKSTNKLIDLVRYVPSTTSIKTTDATSPIAGTLTPTQLERAYGTNLLGLANQGQGVTIGLVEEGTDANIISDANTYSTFYGLPTFNTADGPTFTTASDADIAPVGSARSYGSGGEISLDAEMVHAMAPKANIYMVSVPATGTVANAIKEITEGIQFIAKNGPSNLVAISVSYGNPEANIGTGATNGVSFQNSTYLASTPVSNLAVAVSTGDDSTPGFPATSPNVIAVGGTSLYLNSAQGDYGFETAWGGLSGAGAGGGGTSSTFGTPSFQSNNGVNFGTRSIPDVSMVADVVTAVSVYDSLDSARSPWTAFGGTSVAAPLFAGVISLAQQQRVQASLPILSSAQIDAALYQAYTNPATYFDIFNDVTLGNNSDVTSGGKTDVAGFSATTGYDEATGLGSPWADLMVPYLATGEI